MTYRMDEMTWPQFQQRASKPVIVPVGSTEQHGQHLPIGTDARIAESIATDLAAAVDGTVMPTVSYGYKSKPLSGGGPLFPGTIDMSGTTVISQIHDILRELIDDGFTKIVVLNAHFENEAFIIEAIDMVNHETNGAATIVETNWWDPLDQETIDALFSDVPFPGWALEHAALTETSLLLHYTPELVHMDRMVANTDGAARPYVRYPIKPTDVPAHGALADATGSTAEKGETDSTAMHRNNQCHML